MPLQETPPLVPLEYTPVRGWERLPSGFMHLDCSGVGVDSSDTVYLLTRSQPRVIVYASDGAFVRSWGEELFSEKPHGLTVAPDDTVYVVDEAAHCIYQFSSAGDLLRTIGTPGLAAETGYDGATMESITGGPPFNRPTNLAVAPSGDLYVTDGYGNCRVHRHSGDGELLQSWGEPGGGPGEFRLPHGIAIDEEGVVWIADRENHRIQRFRADGELLGDWGDVHRPTNLVFDGSGRVFVSELAERISVLDRDGRVLARVGAGLGLVAPHDLALDSRGDLYLAEVSHTFTGGAAAPDVPTFHKLARS
jgi:sugar lactone lactonase YvrE